MPNSEYSTSVSPATAGPAVKKGSQKYAAVQILRFVAASYVVVDHAISIGIRSWTDSAQLLQIAWAFGELGVIVFFGISGFIMVNTQYGAFGSKDRALDFAVRRIIRIVPIYFLATTLEYFNKVRHGGGEVYSYLNYAKSILFVPYIGEGGLYRPVLGQGWTLDYEMFFYLVFAITLCMRRQLGLLVSSALLIGLGLLQGTVREHGIMDFYCNRIILYFACGMLVAVLRRRFDWSIRDLFVPTFAVIVLTSIAIVLKVLLSETAFLPVGLLTVFACVYMCASYRSERASVLQRVLERLGDASYSTYLFHGFLMGILAILSAGGLSDHSYARAMGFILLSVVGANLVGLAAFYWLETPIAKLLSRRARLPAVIAATKLSS